MVVETNNTNTLMTSAGSRHGGVAPLMLEVMRLDK